MGFFGWVLGLFRRQPAVQQCETCSRQMRVLEFSGKGYTMMTRDEFASGTGVAEQCWECERIYCDLCYPTRPPNTCVCGQGRSTVRHIGGAEYRGSLHQVKVRYLS